MHVDRPPFEDDCRSPGRVLRPEEGSLDHVVPRSRGNKNAWEKLVWAGQDVNARKGNRLPHEAGLRAAQIAARG